MMFEDSDKVCDTVKFSELPIKQQEDHQVHAMSLILTGLAIYLKDPLFKYLKDKPVRRELDHVSPSVKHSIEIRESFPSPREVREMIRPDTFWAITGIEATQHMEAMRLAEQLARVLYGTSPDDSTKRRFYSSSADVDDKQSERETLQDLAAEAQKSLNPQKIPLEAIRVPARYDGRLTEDPDGDLFTFKPLTYLDQYEGVKAPGGNVFEWLTESRGPNNFSQIPALGEELWLLASDREPRWLLCDVRLDQSSAQMRMLWENVRTLTSEDVVQRGQHLDVIISWLQQYYVKR